MGRVDVDVHAEWLAGRSYRMEDYDGEVLAEGVLREPRLSIPADLPVHAVTLTRLAVGGRSSASVLQHHGARGLLWSYQQALVHERPAIHIGCVA